MSETADTEHVRADRVFDPISDAFGRAAGPDDQAPDPLLELQQAEQGIEPEAEPEPEPEVEYEVVDDEDEWFEPEAEFTPEQIADFQQAFQERWEELADEDPQGAAEALAQLYAGEAQVEMEEQLRGEMEERLTPVVQQHRQEHAAATVAQLEADFGPETFERHKEHLAAAVAADPGRFLDQQTRLPNVDRLREVLMAAEYAYEQNFDWDAYEKAQMGAQVPDTFGRNKSRKATPVTRDQYAALQAENVRRLKKGIRPLPGFTGATRAHSDLGGPGIDATPPSMEPLTRHVDPEVAAMDAAAAPRGRDLYGRYR